MKPYSFRVVKAWTSFSQDGGDMNWPQDTPAQGLRGRVGEGVYKPHTASHVVKGQYWAQVAPHIQPCRACFNWREGWKGSNPAQTGEAGEEDRPALKAPDKGRTVYLAPSGLMVSLPFLFLFTLFWIGTGGDQQLVGSDPGRATRKTTLGTRHC